MEGKLYQCESTDAATGEKPYTVGRPLGYLHIKRNISTEKVNITLKMFKQYFRQNSSTLELHVS